MTRAESPDLDAAADIQLGRRTCWIISDGRAGNDAQSRGVAEALGCVYEMKRVAPRGVFRLLAPYTPVDPRDRFGTSASLFAPPWPDIAIAIGRQTIPYIRAIRRAAGQRTFTVILLDPKVGTSAADLYWVPAHDTLRGPNVITTLTAPHAYSPARLADLRKTVPGFVAALPRPRFAVLTGGPNGNYRYTPHAVARLLSALKSLLDLGAGLIVTPSRRTPEPVCDALRQALKGTASFVWDGAGENPYPAMLAHADAFISTADSINMTGEPCATGRPVYVFEPEGGADKFHRFHAAMRAYGATRPCPARFERFETWGYEPLYAAADIAREIETRLASRRASAA
jgi:mitochondrial fission protein ELM1